MLTCLTVRAVRRVSSSTTKGSGARLHWVTGQVQQHRHRRLDATVQVADLLLSRQRRSRRRGGRARVGQTAPCPSPRGRSRAGGRRPRRGSERRRGARSTRRGRRAASPAPASRSAPPGDRRAAASFRSRRERRRGRRAHSGTVRARGGRRRKRPAHRGRPARSRTSASGQRSSFSSTSRHPPLRRRAARTRRRSVVSRPRGRPSRSPRGARSCVTRRARSAVRSRSWYSSSASAAATTAGRSDDSTVYWPGCVDARPPDCAISEPSSSRRSADLSHQATRVRRMGPERDQVRRQAEDLDPVLGVPPEDRDPSASRLAAISSRSTPRCDIREPQRARGRR